MSIVAIARPAPLTKHPIFPSRPIKFRSYFATAASRGSSCEKSRKAKIFLFGGNVHCHQS